MLLTLLCTPGLFTALILALDDVTRLTLGAAFTSRGFFGGLVGLAAFLSGFVSIVAWPAVVLLSLKAVRKSKTTRVLRGIVILACLVATYSAVFFLFWFVIMPLAATWRPGTV